MKQGGRRPTGHAMRECARCGIEFTMPFLIRQNGILVCKGPGTSDCADLQGHDYDYNRIRYPRREGYEPEPTGNEVIE